jgi:drug/metabolite transporter (DMT)-like permease
MFIKRSPHTQAILKAFFVTFLWSSSVILIKWQISNIPALVFAGLRYVLAFLILLVLEMRTGGLRVLSTLPTRNWVLLGVLGVMFYSITAGTQFLSLLYIPAVTQNFILSATPAVVALIGSPFLGERLNKKQWIRVIAVTFGAVLFFYPASLTQLQALGIVIAILSLLANVLSLILGRAVNRTGVLSPLTVTTISMGIGGILLFSAGVAIQTFPRLAWQSWAVLIWLSVVNTALVFPLWNDSLRILTAIESSVIQNSMAVQIPVFAVLFLGEDMSWKEISGLLVLISGTLIVQFSRQKIMRQ